MKFELFSQYCSSDVINRANQAYSVIKPQWEHLLKNQGFQNQFSLENKQYFHLLENDLDKLFNQESFNSILFMEAFKNLFYQKNLCVVLVWTDVINETKTLTTAAKNLGVRVLQLIHGDLFNFKVGHFESSIYSDKVAVFGQHAKDFFQIQSGAGEKAVITGDPEKDKFFNGELNYNKDHLCNELGFDPKSKIVFFGSTWTAYFTITEFHKDYRDLTIREFLKAFKNLQDEDPTLQLAIKLHPTDYGHSSYYRDLAQEAGIRNYRIFESHLYELLYICDLYTGFRSSIVINALVFDKPVTLINLNEISDEKFFEGLAIKWILRAEDIYPTLKTYLYDEKAVAEIKALIPKSVEYFNYKSDGKATKRVTDLTCKMAEETLSAPVKEQAASDSSSILNRDNTILDLIEFQNSKILFVSSMNNLDMDELQKRSNNAKLVFIEGIKEKPGKTKMTNGTVLNLDFNKGTLDELNLGINSFDYVVFCNSLETFYDPWSMLKSVHPYLKAKGKALVEIGNIRNLNIFSSIVDGYFTYSDKHPVSFDNLRFFTPFELATQSNAAGFQIADCRYCLDESLKQKAPESPDPNVQYNFQGRNFTLNQIPGNSLYEMFSRNIIMTFQKHEALQDFISPLNYPKPANYFNNSRMDLIEMIDKAPGSILEIGCGNGETCRTIKQLYPFCKTTGIDIDEESIKKSSDIFDKAIKADIEEVELSALGIEEESFDYILYGDVLEHLKDPWTVIKKHKRYLKKDGRILASIPNIRHQAVLLPLLYGAWTYRNEGILDSTHLRFFTLREIKRMFRSAGLYIYEIKGNPDIKPADLKIPENLMNVSFQLEDLTLQNIPVDEVPEFYIIQFRIKAGKEGRDLLRW
jgi:2-polyprenyl-3-methyl-5-hydroxy-6-metoxy-1,4-benzoquinol methylase